MLKLEEDKNVLISLVKNDNVDLFLDGTARIYYTGKKFPSTVALNKLYYFMPYIKRRGIRDVYIIKIARVGSKHDIGNLEGKLWIEMPRTNTAAGSMPR